eukprot:jgi/Astpho2/1320/e_gw1.00024.9.1_t
MGKVRDKMDAAIREKRTFFSFEFFPPRTPEGVENLFARADRLASYGPEFCDITWGAGGTTADLTLEIASKLQNMVCVETMMHLTCTNMPKEKLSDALEKVKESGIQNILALRGDPPKGQETFSAVEGGFSCALDLVKHIRAAFGDYFGITVAGYPEAHPDVVSDDPAEMEQAYQRDLAYLKEKVDAGGEVIVTQLFYDVEIFLKFVEDCRDIGIDVPIIPGIMPIMTYGGFKRMTGFCKTKVPKDILSTLESIKDNDEAVKQFGIDLGTQMCRRILDSGVPGLHMYTLNTEVSSVSILENLGLINKAQLPRSLPWRQPSTSRRQVEGVRPIFWSNRPKSYLSRTADWDKFPQGRWGNARSPAYGTLSDYQFMRRHTSTEKRAQKARQSWGATLNGVDSVAAVFAKYTKGEIDMLPWTEMEAMHPEAGRIQEHLAELCQKGLLTINSQPQVNAAPSSDAHVGWGGKDGYVYQKAYVEFFISPEHFKQLQPQLDSKPSITYMAINSSGEVHSNVDSDSVNAVTWGVFPAKEVVQPTVVDPQSFTVWKDEAFELWTTEWGSLYDKGSKSHKVIQSIADNWYLVSVVENDYINGDLFQVLLAA